jgi:CheY-like chemotaxis protein
MSIHRQVFYVEDNPIDQFILQEHNKREKYFSTLTLFSSPFTALEALQEPLSSPDLILLDLMMPCMNGFEFLERLQTIRPEIPVHMLSASIRQKDSEKASEYPQVKAFHQKPLYREMFTHLQVS